MWTCMISTIQYEPVYHVGPDGWKKLSGDDVGELHYKYNPVTPSTVEQEMAEAAWPWGSCSFCSHRPLGDNPLDVLRHVVHRKQVPFF